MFILKKIPVSGCPGPRGEGQRRELDGAGRPRNVPHARSLRLLARTPGQGRSQMPLLSCQSPPFPSIGERLCGSPSPGRAAGTER